MGLHFVHCFASSKRRRMELLSKIGFKFPTPPSNNRLLLYQFQGYVCEKCFLDIENDENRNTHQPTGVSFITPNAPSKRKGTRATRATPTKSPAPKKTCKSDPRTPRFKPIFTSTPLRLDFNSSDSTHENIAKKFGIETSLKYHKYYSVFNTLINHSPAAEKQFNRLVHNKIAEQVKRYVKTSHGYPQFNGIEDLENFHWNLIMSEAQEKMPTFHSAVHGAMHCMEWRSKKLTKHPAKLAKSRYGIVVHLTMR